MASEHNYHIIEWHFNKVNGSDFHSYSKGLFLLLWFITILILLPALFLCVHICRRRRATSADTAVVISQLPAHQCVIVYYTNHTMIPCSTTTKSLSMVGEGFEKKECCICLSDFQDNEKLKWLTECQHVFHSECLDMWLGAHPSCPLCRSSLHVSEDPLKKSSMV
ncbi:PREDICTED: RING-H2 finger protein ATL66-like [Lupinus angustifolius]|uniref:RING-H2 finger protein ATL66-like n=1 Tax=Lupinus angustifolius TaxID=3871 RepID=UPI00092F10CD|nr:PREDICTED: RING-H2 finger protein ATL66-like [Lupinus angustifolius]